MTRNPALLATMAAMRATMLAASLSLGCATSAKDAAFAPPSDPASLYWLLRVDQHAVQLLPDSTLQLHAATYTALGTTYTPPAGVAVTTTWRSLDSTKVTVSPTGLIGAVAVTQNPVKVIVAQQVGNLTRADTLQVKVSTNTSVLATFSITPTDSAKVAASSSRFLAVQTLLSNGTAIPGVMAYYHIQDTTVARLSSLWTSGNSVSQTSVLGKKVGTTLVTGTVWMNGVAKTDTFTLTVGYPISNLIVNVGYFPEGPNGSNIPLITPDTIVIGPGGSIRWTNNTGTDTINVIFDQPSFVLADSSSAANNSGPGDILAIPSDTLGAASLASRSRFRRIVVPGTYSYTIQPYGIVGYVVVKPE
jgi:hypothetical protein